MYSLFHHFVQQFLRVQVKLYHYFDFSLCLEPHQRDTHTSGSTHSGPAFVLAADAEQNLPREKRFSSLLKYRYEVWYERVH